MVVRVVVHGLRGEKFIIDLCDTVEQFQSITVLQLREKIHEKIPYICCCENPEKVQLIFIGRRLDDSSALLISYGIQHLSAIHMVVKVPGGGGGPGWGDGGMGDKEGKKPKYGEALLPINLPWIYICCLLGHILLIHQSCISSAQVLKQ